MKKFTAILCAMICVLGLTACGPEEKTLDPQVAAELESRTAELVTNLLDAFDAQQAEELTSQGGEYMEFVLSNYFGYKCDGNGIVSAFTSWNNAKAEIGDIVTISGAAADYDDQGSDIIVTLDVVGVNRTAQIEAIYEDDLYHTIDSITTNVNWTFGEKMSKAGLNTLMGMGTVFIILILISLIISLFKYISVIQDKLAGKGKADVKAEAVDKTIAQIVEKEEQTDDLELIAVITAAIAAAGTSGSSDDFVVRSIRRRPNSQWNKA